MRKIADFNIVAYLLYFNPELKYSLSLAENGAVCFVFDFDDTHHLMYEYNYYYKNGKLPMYIDMMKFIELQQMIRKIAMAYKEEKQS
jgi:hypothetical protein